MRLSWAGCLIIPALTIGAITHAQDLVKVRQSFDSDPGWEAYQNRIECTNCPTVTQDFGWSPTSHASGTPGEIGGAIWASTIPAHYGLPFGRPLSFRDTFSASGTIAVPEREVGGVAYIGFFNSTRQNWRPWSSIAFSVASAGRGPVRLGVAYMTAQWGAGGFETDMSFPADGSIHRWRLDYDPQAVPPSPWPDPPLQNWLTRGRQTVDDILPRARQDEPNLTREELLARLRKALAEGLVAYLRRGGNELWLLHENYAGVQGALTVQLDDDVTYKFFLAGVHHNQPVFMDRFGIFNHQLYRSRAEFYVSDLTVNGIKIDLSRDPGWVGEGNRDTYTERDFQRQDFGYSETNWAGEQIGEIGGQFCRVEATDPLYGYYLDDIGTLTLDDPFSFSGNICFVDGATDAGMYIGYFNLDDMKIETDDARGAYPLNNSLVISIDGPSALGYYFNPILTPNRQTVSSRSEIVYLPKAEPTTFSVEYDPEAGENGRITVKLGDRVVSSDLRPDQRKANATFNRFGLAAMRIGGKCLHIYFDDLTYTARRPNNYQPVGHAEKVLKVPYPGGGREN